MDFANRKLWDQDIAVSAVGSIEGLFDYARIRADMSRNFEPGSIRSLRGSVYYSS